MAWYGHADVRYKGRLVRFSTRYGCFQDYKILKGKRIRFTRRDFLRMERIIARHEELACGCLYLPPEIF